ncbi:MAG TPA: hypothetical protein VK043_06940 [Burkholderiales bacterium]|nr:hypothetical protein [Burkholderiales bacterium]
MPVRTFHAAFLAAMALAIAGGTGALAADGHTIAISAAVLSKSNCKFQTPSSVLPIAIDPASGTPATGTVAVSIRCQGSASIASWGLSHNAGLHGSGPAALLMRHQTQPSQFLPYSLSYPTSGTIPKGVWTPITLTATVVPASFANAVPGTYTDTVSLTLLP